MTNRRPDNYLLVDRLIKNRFGQLQPAQNHRYHIEKPYLI
jgi:hypothetical protein